MSPRRIYKIAYFLGIIKLFYFFNKGQRVLIYHHVLPSEKLENNLLYGYCHSEKNFEKHLKEITKKFEITTEFGKNNSVVITFDDGIKNNLTYVCPILEKFNVNAFFYVVGDILYKRRHLWVDKWLYWLSYIPSGSYEIMGKTYRIEDNNRPEIHNMLWDRIMQENIKESDIIDNMDKNYAFSKLEEEFSDDERLSPLAFEEVSNMKKKGHKIGYHSKSHKILKLLGENELNEQLECESVKEHLNSNSFAIPFGTSLEFDERVLKKIKEYGYGPILLNQEEAAYKDVLPRLELSNTSDKYEIHAQLSGFKSFIKKFI